MKLKRKPLNNIQRKTSGSSNLSIGSQKFFPLQISRNVTHNFNISLNDQSQINESKLRPLVPGMWKSKDQFGQHIVEGAMTTLGGTKHHSTKQSLGFHTFPGERM